MEGWSELEFSGTGERWRKGKEGGRDGRRALSQTWKSGVRAHICSPVWPPFCRPPTLCRGPLPTLISLRTSPQKNYELHRTGGDTEAQ